jgi:hypothetical protein
MPFSPNDFEWWVWLLFGVGGFMIAGICYLLAVVALKWGVKIFFGLLTLVVGTVGAACVLITLIRFVKWAWGS